MNMRNITLGALALGLSASGGAAHAAHTVVYGPRVEAFTSSQAHRGPYVYGSTTDVVNGTIMSQSVSEGGTTSGGGSSTSVYSQSTQDGGAGDVALHSETYASTDLASGTLRASVGATGPSNFGSPLGFSSARLQDTIYFTNTSGSAQIANLTFTFDGLASLGPDHSPSGTLGFDVSCLGFNCFNEANTPILFGGPGSRVADGAMYYMFSRVGNNIASCFGENIYCGQGSAPYFTTHLDQSDVDGLISGYITTQLIIPTGTTSLGLGGRLDLDCRGGSTCGFGHTGRFGFDPLPDGLSFSSASGVFLTDAGAVPEPASWAMMIAGFGLVGAAMRRRGGQRSIRVQGGA